MIRRRTRKTTEKLIPQVSTVYLSLKQRKKMIRRRTRKTTEK
jgi:hypothetical protein